MGTPAPAAAAPAAPVAGRPPTSTGAAVSRPAPASHAAAPRPAAPAVRRVSGLDVGLGIAAGVIALGAVAAVLLLLQIK